MIMYACQNIFLPGPSRRLPGSGSSGHLSSYATVDNKGELSHCFSVNKLVGQYYLNKKDEK